MLEIGVGGYDNPYIGGNSLRMWKSFFPFAKITSLDIYDKSFLQEKRINIFQGSQIDDLFLESIINQTGEFDLIIDDGSHVNNHVIKSFEILFPTLKKGGIYVIEDTQTSYWEDYGGTSKDFNSKGTIYHYFKSLIDSLNNEEFIIDNYQKNYYDQHIISMHFYHNMIFIYKGENNEISNKVRNNQFK
ncbi:MAG: class I SAM-dependent methyltransferase [Flavobacteriaceae bacterium]|nr:class I SAM-dependent methyltransferase [Flavobacteriaceae bacterium]